MSPLVVAKISRLSVEVAAPLISINPAAPAPLLLNDIELPVFVFSGSDDTVVPDLARHMAKVDRDNVRFEEIDGADHFFRDLYVYDIVDSALEFLEAAGTHSD